MNYQPPIEWPVQPPTAPPATVGVDGPATRNPSQPLLPLALDEHVELILGSPAIRAFAAKRAVQIVTHGHTPEKDLERSIAMLAHEAKHRLDAFTEIVPIGRMNLPPAQRDRCLRYVEIAGGILIALWDRCQVEVPDDWPSTAGPQRRAE